MSMQRSMVLTGLLGIVGLGLALVWAGPLDPPAGPVTPSYKTLTEVEPRTALSQANTPGDADSVFRITQPGSYYLTSNLVGVAGKHGIEIGVGSVTIDLNGFEVRGPGTAEHGIVASGIGLTHISLRNGTVRDWIDAGVSLDRVSIGSVTDIISSNVNGAGIVVGDDYSVRNCTVSGNLFDGVRVGRRSSVSNCNAFGNLNGIVTGNGCTIDSCVAARNIVSGIRAGQAAVITACTADANGLDASALSEGIFADDGSIIIGCTSQNNTSALTGGVGDRGMGFRTGDRCVIRDCTASRNLGHGFRLETNSRITGCMSVENGSGSTSSAGIQVVGDQNQVDNNQVNGSDFGVRVLAPANIIFGNTARGNGTAYNFVADNIYGPIIDRRVPTTVPTTPAVNGFAATGTLGSTDSRANFAY